MVLTARDRDILRQVYSHRLLTREQIERLLFQPDHGQDHFTKTSKVRKRLKLLFQHGYLERIPMSVGVGTWAWQPVYRLARKGADLIAVERGVTLNELVYWGKSDDKDQRTSQVSPLFLQHTVQVNDVRIAVTLAAQWHGYAIEKWIDDTQLKSQEMKEYVAVTERGGLRRIAVIPDAYFSLSLGNRRAPFFLELDRATMSTVRWNTRVKAYMTYLRTGKYTERYQSKSLRILTVTTTPLRMWNLMKATVKAGGKGLFWFTTFDQVNANSVFFSPIWLLASDERDSARKVLIE